MQFGRLAQAALRFTQLVEQRVFEVLNDRFREPVRISELAAVAAVHPVHFARVFRAHYGVTPGVYMRRLRLQWAARQLAVTKTSLSQIAAEAGFSDQSHFGRVFKQHFGIPPGKIRVATEEDERLPSH